MDASDRGGRTHRFQIVVWIVQLTAAVGSLIRSAMEVRDWI
ncbi:hypothetical protein [Symbioplanes lichenis]|nr:hypothetical protein [Actinoplanes lichenis]